MSSSRVPLSSTVLNRESALTRTTAARIKRKSIGLPSAASAAAKRARPLVSRPATPPGSSGGAVAPTPATTSRLARPLSSSMMTGRATVAGSALRPPTTYPSRQRTASGASATPLVDEEKENLKKSKESLEKRVETAERRLEQTENRLEQSEAQLEEARRDRDEERREKLDERREKEEQKMQKEEERRKKEEERRKKEEVQKELEAEREAHAASRAEAAHTIARLRNEAIAKDEAMRSLHNDVVDLRGRIRVAVRVRPLLAKEEGESTAHLSYPNETTIAVEQQMGKIMPFSFNHVYGPTYSQQRLFDGVKELIMSVLHGYNVSVISYGQTGSGKTHTMRGGEEAEAGLIPRAVQFLFDNRHRLEDLDWQFDFAASFLEVYNNECYDLLSTPPRAKREIKQLNAKFVVDALTVEPITEASQMASLLRKSDANRSTAATKCNETSSRSHALFALSVKGRNKTTGANIDCVLKLVDLAGSERAKETGATGERFNEMTHINTALSNLQTCIRSILTKQSHVPYRNSKLTTLLQDSLSGGSKCQVILSLSPQLSTINESKRTLEFGRNMSQTHIGAAKKKET